MRRTIPLLAAFLLAAAAPAAQPITWQEAVARLKFERTQAEICAGALKKIGDTAAKERGALTYTDAKAEYDAIIGGLDVALASDQKPASLPDLEDRMTRGFNKRQAFCDWVKGMLPPPAPGHEKGSPLADIVNGAVGPVLDAVKSIWGWTLADMRKDKEDKREDTKILRASIAAELEDAKWQPFASVPPLS